MHPRTLFLRKPRLVSGCLALRRMLLAQGLASTAPPAGPCGPQRIMDALPACLQLCRRGRRGRSDCRGHGGSRSGGGGCCHNHLLRCYEALLLQRTLQHGQLFIDFDGLWFWRRFWFWRRCRRRRIVARDCAVFFRKQVFQHVVQLSGNSNA